VGMLHSELTPPSNLASAGSLIPPKRDDLSLDPAPFSIPCALLLISRFPRHLAKVSYR
jgi:hypothetical protein